MDSEGKMDLHANTSPSLPSAGIPGIPREQESVDDFEHLEKYYAQEAPNRAQDDHFADFGQSRPPPPPPERDALDDFLGFTNKETKTQPETLVNLTDPFGETIVPQHDSPKKDIMDTMMFLQHESDPHDIPAAGDSLKDDLLPGSPKAPSSPFDIKEDFGFEKEDDTPFTKTPSPEPQSVFKVDDVPTKRVTPEPEPKSEPAPAPKSGADVDKSFLKFEEAVAPAPAPAPAPPKKTPSPDSKCCEMGIATWFNTERLHPKVEALVYWRDPKKSGIVFGGVMVVLLSLSFFSLISVIANLSLLTLAATFGFRIYKTVMQAIQKTSDGHPFKEILEMDVALPAEKVRQTSDLAVTHINAAIIELRRLFLVEDLVDSVKFGVTLWLLTYLGSWFNGMTLIILAFVALFTVPKLYESNKAQVDQNLDLVRSKINDITAKVKAAIPLGKKAEEKKEQ